MNAKEAVNKRAQLVTYGISTDCWKPDFQMLHRFCLSENQASF